MLAQQSHISPGTDIGLNKALKILQLEDNADDAEIIRRELKKGEINFNYLLVDNKTDFVNALTEYSPDIILSDHSLPSFDSKEALEIVLQQYLKIPFILIADTVSEEFAVQVMKSGATDYILKKHLQRLPSAVLKAIEKYRIEEEAYNTLEALRNSEANLKTVFDNTDTAYILLDVDLKILSYNLSAGNVFARQFDRQLTKWESIIEYIPQNRKEGMMRDYARVLEGSQLNYETKHLGPGGKSTWYSVQLSAVVGNDEKIIGIVSAFLDITKRKNSDLEKEKLSEDLKTSHLEFKKLIEHVQTVWEEQRLHIAREVHDELGQLLTAAKIEVSVLNKKLSNTFENGAAQLDFSHVLALIDKSIQSVKKIATDLRPAMLDDLGLVGAIRWQLEEFEKTTGIEFSLTISQNFSDLSNDINRSTTLYRIMQEALTNVARHAYAKKVEINIKTSIDNVFMVIQDNGVGIKEDQKNKKTSFGLTGIRERVLLLDGIIDIKARPEGGTMVYVQIPYISTLITSKY